MRKLFNALTLAALLSTFAPITTWAQANYSQNTFETLRQQLWYMGVEKKSEEVAQKEQAPEWKKESEKVMESLPEELAVPLYKQFDFI